MTPPDLYETPYHWWGPGPVPAAPPTLRDLLHNGTITVESAALLWAAVAQHRSLTVIGGPSRVGKSTLLHALLPAVPQGNHRLYLRGCYETFAFLDDRRFPPAGAVLLANEISPHLPIYLWGPAVQRTLTAGDAGYQILATAHGRSVGEFAASLTGSPLRIPARMLAALGLVAIIAPEPDGAGRRVSELWQLSPARDGVAIDRLGPGDLPAGVTTDQVAAARAAVLSLVWQGDGALCATRPPRDGGQNGGLPGACAMADLEQTPAGE